MVFSETFFHRRGEVVASYQAKGFTELGELLEQHRLCMDHLVPAGVLEVREGVQVPSVCFHQPTAMGKAWLVAERKHDLILVKPMCQAHVLALALAAPPPDPEQSFHDWKNPGWLWAFRLVRNGLPRNKVDTLQRSVMALYKAHGIVLTMDLNREPHVLFCSALPTWGGEPSEVLAHCEAALALLVPTGIMPCIVVLDPATGKADAARKHAYVGQGKTQLLFRVSAPRAVFRTQANGLLDVVALEDESLSDAKRSALLKRSMAWADRAPYRR